MQPLRPLRAIRVKCLDCSGGQIKEVRECQCPACTLYPYRMGKRPKTHERHEAKKNATADGSFSQG